MYLTQIDLRLHLDQINTCYSQNHHKQKTKSWRKYYAFPILTLKITPQTVLFNDEDFHSVKILKTVVRQSDVLAHRKKWLF